MELPAGSFGMIFGLVFVGVALFTLVMGILDYVDLRRAQRIRQDHAAHVMLSEANRSLGLYRAQRVMDARSRAA